MKANLLKYWKQFVVLLFLSLNISLNFTPKGITVGVKQLYAQEDDWEDGGGSWLDDFFNQTGYQEGTYYNNGNGDWSYCPDCYAHVNIDEVIVYGTDMSNTPVDLAVSDMWHSEPTGTSEADWYYWDYTGGVWDTPTPPEPEPCTCTTCPVCGGCLSAANSTSCPAPCPGHEPEPCDIDFSSPETTFKGVGFVQAELRAMYPILAEGLGITASASLGFMMDRNGGMGIYYTNSFGICSGMGVVGGLAIGVMPTATSIQQMGGYALNAGYVFAYDGVSRSGEVNLISVDPIISETGWDDLRLGASYSTPGYIGVGAGAYIDISQTTFLFINSGASISTVTQMFNSILPFNITDQDILNLMNITYSNLWNYNKSYANDCDD